MTPEQTACYYAQQQADGALPTVALSVKQPWAFLIVNGLKDLENRDWRRTPPSRALIHAGQSIDADAHEALKSGLHPASGGRLDAAARHAYQESLCLSQRGGFVGVADFTGAVVEESDNPWFMGRYGYMLANARPLPFLPWRGMLGFFPAKI